MREARSHAQCSEHGAVIGDAAAGDVVGATVIGRGANDGKADSGVHPVSKAGEFDRDETLIVIHGDDNIEFATAGTEENGVGGVWTGGIKMLGGTDGWDDDVVFFGAEGAGFAGVRVESAHCDARLRDAQLATREVGKFYGCFDAIDGERVWDGTERLMNRDENHAEAGSGEHHSVALRAGDFSKQVGVTLVAVTGSVDGRFR